MMTWIVAYHQDTELFAPKITMFEISPLNSEHRGWDLFSYRFSFYVAVNLV
jgi:hypothetical protein